MLKVVVLEVAAFMLGHEDGEFVLFNTVLTAPSTALARACSRGSPALLDIFRLLRSYLVL